MKRIVNILGILLLSIFCLQSIAFASLFSVKDATVIDSRTDAVDSLFIIAEDTCTLTISLDGLKKEQKDSIGLVLAKGGDTIRKTFSADSTALLYKLKAGYLCKVVGFKKEYSVAVAQYKPIDSLSVCPQIIDTLLVQEGAKKNALSNYSFYANDNKYLPQPKDTAIYKQHTGKKVFPALSEEELRLRVGDQSKYDSVQTYYRDSTLASFVQKYETTKSIENILAGQSNSWKDSGYCYVFKDTAKGSTDEVVYLLNKKTLYKDQNGELIRYCDEIDVYILPSLYYIDMTKGKNDTVYIDRTFSVAYEDYDGESGTVQARTEDVSTEHSKYVSLPTSRTKTRYYLTETFAASNYTKKDSTSLVDLGVSVRPKIIFPEKVEHNRQDEVSERETYFPNSEYNTEFSAPLAVEMFGNPSPTTNYLDWYFSNESTFRPSRVVHNQENLNVEIKYVKDKNQYIKFKATNMNSGCADSAFISLRLKVPELVVPNIFTPGSDKNYEFRVSYVSIRKFHIVIYNTFGKKVYESDDITQGWDGTYKGNNMPNGAYYYIIAAEDADGKEIKKKGTVNLYREVRD